MRRRRMVFLPGGTARAGPGSGVPRRALTTRVMAATPGQPGVRAPGGLVVRERAREEVCCCGTTRRRAARPQKTPGGRRARWRRACSVLCDCRALATAGAPGTEHNPVAMLKPDSWRGAHTEVLDFEVRRTRIVNEGAKAWMDPEGYRQWVVTQRAQCEATVAKEMGVQAKPQ